jgi:tetratricopeptide (TPR) repeat protein
VILAQRLLGRHAGVVFVADDLAAWLIGFLAEAGRKKLTSLVLGDEQQRALRPAATEAVRLTAAELCRGDAQRAEELAVMIGPLFKTPVPGAPLGEQATVLEALQAGIGGQLALLDDPGLTATVGSLTGMGEVPATVVAQKLTGHLVREIMVRGSRGGPLAPLAHQLSDDRTYLHGLQMEGKVDRLDDKLLEILALLGGTRAMAAAPVALAQLPAVTAGFTGRDGELAVLAGLLDPAGSAAPVVVSAVAGLAGVGKTTLAVQAGHVARQRGWFGGGVLFVDLHGYDETPVEPGQALDALLRALRVPAADIPPAVEERAGLYRSVLAQIPDPVLVIADNASSEAQVRPLLPGSGPHKVVVTSRHTLAGLDARLVDVTVLDDDAAVELLDGAMRAARPDDDRISAGRAAAGRLAGVCGGLPLALQITAALLKADPALSASELAGELSDEKDRLAALRYDDGSGQGAPSVAAAFELSYRRLDETSARVFRLLPVNPGPDVSTAAAAVLADLPAREARTMLAGLARAHLAEAAPGVAGRWRMHDLVRLYAQRLSDACADADGREQARDRLLGHYLHMTDAADDHLRALPGVAVPEEFTGRDGALAWLDAERACLVAAVTMAAGTGRDHVALRLPLILAEYLQWRRRFDDSLAVTTISLETARHLGDWHREGMALANIGNALREVRRFEEAITACQEAAAIFLEVGDWHREGMALNNLGLALRHVGRFEEAITAHQAAAAIYHEIGDWHREGTALTNLGLALQGAGRFEEAITAHQAAAAIYREAGGRHREGNALNNLGTALQAVQRFEEAITAHQAAAAIYREAGDRYREGAALNNLGLALRHMGQFEEAITAYRDAAAIYRETGDHDSERMALDDLEAARAAQRT